MSWPDDAPIWLRREAEKEPLIWAWQEEQLSGFELEPLYDDADVLIGILAWDIGRARLLASVRRRSDETLSSMLNRLVQIDREATKAEQAAADRLEQPREDEAEHNHRGLGP
jgi:hypothetical protein